MVRSLWWSAPFVLWTLVALFVALLDVDGCRERECAGTELFDRLRTGLAFHAGLGLLFSAVLHRARGRLARAAANALAFPPAFAALLVQTFGHNFLVATGSPLDWTLLVFSVVHATRLFRLTVSEARPAALGGLALLALLIAAFSWRVGRRGSAFTFPPADGRASLRIAVAGAVLLALALVPPLGRDRALARATLLHVAASGLAFFLDSREDGSTSTSHRIVLSGEPQKRKNVAIVVLEATRWDATTLADPSLATTETLASLAPRSLVAERAYSVLPFTSKELVAILCGIEPRFRLHPTETEPGRVPVRCLPALLRERGWRTAYFEPSEGKFISWRGLLANLGFESVYMAAELPVRDFERISAWGWEEEVMIGPTRELIESSRAEGRPFFAVFLTLSSHHDYRFPTRYGRMKLADNELYDRYLNGVRAGDLFVRRVEETLREAGVLDDTILIVTGDHGQGFGEHGRFQSADVIYEEGIRVPLVIRDPSRLDLEGKRLSTAVSHLDLAPTIADLLGFRLEGRLPGASLLSSPVPDRVVRAHCWMELRCMARVQGTRKVVHHFRWRPDELFDLATDPHERRDLASDHPDEVRRAVEDLRAWRAGVNASWPVP